MTTGGWLGVAALVVDALLLGALIGARRRTECLQARVRALEARLHDDLAPAGRRSRSE